MMTERLRQAGLSLKFRVATSRAFWSEPDASMKDIDDSTVEATYVDDKVAAIIAPTPATLCIATTINVSVYIEVCTDVGLEINWKKGKSEAMFSFRGRRSTAQLDRFRCSEGLAVPVGGSDSVVHKLVIVQSYKHLGGVISINGSII